MPIRLLAAAFMAALGATLGLMLARVAAMPAVITHVPQNDLLLLHQIGLGFTASMILLLLALRRGQAAPTLGEALFWGAAGFHSLVLAPWLILPDSIPGQISGESDGMLLWLCAVGASVVGFWALHRPGLRRLAGLVLLALPLLLGQLGGGADGDGLVSPDYGHLPGDDPEFGVWRALGLNLLFWLLLGIFSMLAARRVMRLEAAKTGAPEAPPGPSSEG